MITVLVQSAVAQNDNIVDVNLERSIRDFHQSMLVYLDFMPLVLDLAHVLSSQASLSAVEAFLEREGKDKQVAEDGVIYELSAEAVAQLEKLYSAMIPSFSVQDTLAKNVLAGIVSSLDALIGNLIKAVCYGVPGAAITGDETVLARDIFKHSTLDEFKEHLISKEVDAQSQAGLDSQIKWIGKRLGLEDIPKNYAHWSALGEIFQRRHVIVHANGFVSAKYIQSAAKYGYDVSDVTVGDTLKVKPDYVNAAINVVFEFGIMLSHIVRTKLANFEADKAAGDLNQLCLSLLQRGDYALAKSLLEFASKLRGEIKERTKDTILLNLANAHKLDGDLKACNKIILKRDWSNVGLDFIVCKDAVQGDVDGVIAAMRKSSFKEFFTEAHCQEWPVFFHVRDDERFLSAFEQTFGQKFIPRSRQMNSIAEIVGGLGATKMVLELSPSSKFLDASKHKDSPEEATL